MEDGLLKAVDYSLDELMIVGSGGNAVRLDQVVKEINIFEDLFSNIMSGDIFINDTQNIINVLPIVGAEYLRITFSKPSTPWKMSQTFRVYKITDRKKVSAFSENYVLHFCSEEAILNESIKISKAYKGMPVSKIVKDIATTYLGITPDKFPDRFLVQTTDAIDVIVPYWTPFYTINWLARIARTGFAPGCSFVFFEDHEGFHFAPIEMLTQQAELQAINFMPMNNNKESEDTDTSIMKLQHESAQEYELVNAPDTLRGITSGLYASKLVRINPLDQRIDISTLDGTRQFKSLRHANKYPYTQTDRDRLNLQQHEHTNAFFRVAVDNLKVESWMLQRNFYLTSLHGFQLKVVVAGNMNYRVGQVVTVNLPAATHPTRDQKPIDALYSGNYLITAIRHKLDRTKYVCILELSKDSLVTPLPTPVEGNPTVNTLRRS